MRRHAPRLLFCMMMAVAAFNTSGALAQSLGINSLSGAPLIINAGGHSASPAFMTIDTTGHVGIGMMPAQTLDVAGNIRSTGGADGYLLLDGTNGGEVMFTKGGSNKWAFGTDVGATGSMDDLNIYNYGSTTVRMSISNTTGNIQLNGSVGIGVTAPAATLDVNGMTYLEHNVGIGVVPTAGSPYALDLGTYQIHAGAYFHGSDARLKTDIRPIDHALDKILALKGIEFNWKKDGRPDMGMTAQNVSEVFPNIVNHGPDGMMSVEYDSMIGPMIEAIRELKLKNDHLESEIADLKKEIGARKDAQP